VGSGLLQSYIFGRALKGHGTFLNICKVIGKSYVPKEAKYRNLEFLKKHSLTLHVDIACVVLYNEKSNQNSAILVGQGVYGPI
jgi:hypothetical protein